MEFKDIFEDIDRIEGWMGKEDCEALYKAVRNVKGLIVEIGTYAGRSTKLIALSSPESKVISIDIKEHEDVRKNLKGTKILYIVSPSDELGKSWGKEIDLIHIDGDHRYEAVKKDIERWVPHLKKGSWVYLHDYVVLGDPIRIAARANVADKKMYYDSQYGVVRAINELKDKYFDMVEVRSGFAACRKK